VKLTLRARLLLSYVLLLVVMLAVVAGALILFLSAQPEPTSTTYQRLAADAREFVSQNDLSAFRPLQIIDQLNTFAEANGLRAVIVNLAQDRVLYDSENIYARGDALTLNSDAYALPRYLLRAFPPRVVPVFGSFKDPDNTRWAYIGLMFTRPGGQEMNSLLMAQRRPPQSFQEVVQRFREELAMPLVQAGVVGMLAAFILAAFISRSIARSLKSLAGAAAAVAEGHYDQRVPENGPMEIQAVAQAFNRMSEQVRDTQQAQQDFLANVSHDLKTPLTSIQGYSQAIIDGAAKDPRSAANIIYEEAGRLNRMVIQLTDLARLQAGRLSMHMTAIELGQLTKAIGGRLAIVAQEKGVSLEVNAPRVPEVAGDGDRLAQVITNLVSNAIKYTPSGGRVSVCTQATNGGVELVVSDNGIGIPPGDLPRIFERFYQVDKARGPRRGTGLGLAIVAEIVHAHSGKITASSAGPGKGSTFTLWLPSPQASTIMRMR
jgi:two-component system OmpR family sensor kinase